MHPRHHRLLVALLTILLGLGVAGAPSALASLADPTPRSTEAPAVARAGDFTGTVALSNCSGSVVRPAGTAITKPALVLSNGHCLEEGFLADGEVVINRPTQRTFSLLSGDGQSTVATLRATKVAYATMTDTDISLYELDQSYQQIQRLYKVPAFELSAQHPQAGTPIDIVSGYWKTKYSCAIDGFVPQLREGAWTWRDSLRYTPPPHPGQCKTIGGTSGSPIIDRSSGKVIGVNNTGNEKGETCTTNNPCEVAADGQVTVRPGANYGQQTYGIADCLTADNQINLRGTGCTLPRETRKPNASKAAVPN